MKNTSTMNLDVIINRSLYLQELLLKLPDDRLNEILVGPRPEVIESIKVKLRAVCEGRNES